MENNIKENVVNDSESKKVLTEKGSKVRRALHSEDCRNISAILNKIIAEKGYDYLYTNPMDAYMALPKKKASEAKLSNAVIYALLSGVGNKNRNKLSVVRSEIESLFPDQDTTVMLDKIFSSLWEENFLKESKEKEYGGYEEFCFRLWDVECNGGAVWKSADEKEKVVLNYKYNIKFKVENSTTVFRNIGPNHYLSADDIATKYKKGLEEALLTDFKVWCDSSTVCPKAESYDLERGETVLNYYLEDNGLVSLLIEYQGNTNKVE